MSESNNSDSVLEIKNLLFTYHKNTKHAIIDELNFSIKKHEIISIAGPNGAGKTTFLKLLVGLLKPLKGSFFLNNKEIFHPRELLHSIGLVFQNPDEQVFFPKVEDDIAFSLRNLGLTDSEINESVHSVMHALKITYLYGRSFFSLSFGEKKKVSIAGTLVTKPEILILDEPTIGLDPWSKAEFIDIIKNLATETSLIIATHDRDILNESNKVYFLWDGKFIRIFDNILNFDEFSKTFIPNRE